VGLGGVRLARTRGVERIQNKIIIGTRKRVGKKFRRESCLGSTKKNYEQKRGQERWKTEGTPKIRPGEKVTNSLSIENF